MDGVVVNIDLDHIPVLDRGDGTAIPGFGGDMANTGPPCRAGIASVGDHGTAGVQPHAHQHSGGDGHFPHAWASLGPFIADDQDAAGLDGPLCQKLAQVVLRVEAHSRPPVVEHLRDHAALFHDAAVGGQIAV